MTNIKENSIWHGLSLNTIYNMDCLEGMKLIPDGSIDAIITDPPYWTTACKWDSVIPFEPMWAELKRIIKPNGAIVLFGSEPFSSALRMSNIKMYKYDWIWEKDRPTGMFLKDIQPMKYHEIISVFWKEKLIYNPQMWEWKQNHSIWKSDKRISEHYWEYKHKMNKYWNMKFPRSIIVEKKEHPPIHPTQKPVALIEYLIKTYTNEWETVLDFTMWSGTTAVACLNTNRNFIWFELDEQYRNIANNRIAEHKKQSENSLFW